MSEGTSTPTAPSSGGAPAAPAAPASAPSVPSTAAAPAANSPPPATSGEPAANGAPPPKAEPWRRKVKVHGREIEVDDKEIPQWLRDAAGEDEALSLYRIKTAGMTSLKEAAEQRKQADAIMSRLKGDSMVDALLELHGGDAAKVDAAMERYYAQRLREAEMSPQEREHARLQREIAEMQQRKEAEQRERQEAEHARRKQEYAQRWQAEFPEAAKAAKLPWGKGTARRMVAHAREALAAGEQIDPQQIARDVAAELREEWHALHGEADDDSLLELIGDERMKRIRARDVERLKAQQAPAAPPPAPRNPETGQFQRKADERPMSTRDFFAKRRGLL